MMKNIIKKIVPSKIMEPISILWRTRPLHKRECPICGHQGLFKNFGRPPRIDALCPNCKSLERHRLFWLWYKNNPNIIKAPILHFAAEKILESQFRKTYDQYSTADLFEKSDLKLNIEKIDLPDESINTVVCNHVLEHVDDTKALTEIHRILHKKGILVASIPIIEGWTRTYENPLIIDRHLRELHFGQGDHVRFYGADFRERLKANGFTIINEYTAAGEEIIKHSLTRGEKIFVCAKA